MGKKSNPMTTKSKTSLFLSFYSSICCHKSTER